MGIFDRFKKQNVTEANTVFGQTALGNQILIGNKNTKGGFVAGQQFLYVTTSSTTAAGRVLDMTTLTRNSTVMACVGVKARALAQLPVSVMRKEDDGTFTDVLKDTTAGNRDKFKAKQIVNLLMAPNNFQSKYEFWYQWSMWQDLMGESFTLWFRKDKKDSVQTPIEMYNLDSSLITVGLTELRYPFYQLSSPTMGFQKGQQFSASEIMHIKEAAWQGQSGFNKGILASELISLDQDIDVYANFVMQNGAKPSGIFITEQVIPDNKFKEIAARLKEAWSNLTGTSPSADPSKPGQGMLLDQGMKYQPVDMLTLQDADAAQLKLQVMKRICGLFGVNPQMIGIGEGKFNNTQTMLDEFYKGTMYPMVINIEQKLNQHLLAGYPNLCIRFDTKEFLKGAPLDQINFVSQGVKAGIMTPNEAREYLNMAKMDGADELEKPGKAEPMPGQSPQDTGGGGGNQTKRANIGAT